MRSRQRQVVSKLTILVLVGLGMCSGMANGEPLQLPMGKANVDGDLSEWGDANWIVMDQVYYTSTGSAPPDLSNAEWTAMWSSDPDMIYVAVRGVDTDHVFNDSNMGWDAQDSVEIYMDAADSNMDGYNDDGEGYKAFATAQQYVGGAWQSEVGKEWLTLAGGPIEPLEAGIVPAFEVAVSGDLISYEIAMKPYTKLDTDDPESSTVLPLAAGMTLGLDVVMDSKHQDGFGMLCQNTDGRKYGDAAQLLSHTTVPEPSAIVLLLTSVICLVFCMRRRRIRAE